MQSVDFEVHEVLKSPTQDPITAPSKISINYMDGRCLYGFNIHEQELVVILIGHRDEEGVYQNINQGCAPTHLPVTKDGKVKLNDEHMTLSALKLRIKSL